jgi:hypothetical protein
VIAMSGAFSGSEVPAGVVADAFYQKGSSILALLKIIEALPQRELRPPQLPGVLTQRDLNVSSDRTPTQSLLRERTSTFTALAAPLLDS